MFFFNHKKIHFLMKFNSVCCAITIMIVLYVSMCFSVIGCNSQTRSCREKRPLAPHPPPLPLLLLKDFHSLLHSNLPLLTHLSDPNATLLRHHHCSSHSVHPSLFFCLHHPSSLTHKHTYNTPIFTNLEPKQ